MTSDRPIVVLCGGVGAARLLIGMTRVVADEQLIAVVNTGDDMVMHGLHISPDLDTVVYTVSGQVSKERGWGLEGETWQAMEMVGRYGGQDWFALGDRDLGTHLYRTDQLQQGRALSDVTGDIARTWGLGFRVLPATDNPLRTKLTTVDGDELTFQEYFVGRSHDVAVSRIRFEGARAATPAPGVLDAIANAERVIVAPSNPAVSIDPILAIPGIRDALKDRRSSVVAVSPIVAGDALKGPAARLLRELGSEASVAGVAEWYQSIAGTLVIDSADRDRAADIEAVGVKAVTADTIMVDPAASERLAQTLLTVPVGDPMNSTDEPG